MSKLILMGQLKHDDAGKKYISFHTQSRQHLLPIVTDDDAAEGAWVRFSGKLHTQSIPEGDHYRKVWFGLGDLFPSEKGLYANEFTVDGATVVRVDNLRTTPLTLRKIVDFVVAEGDNYYNCIAFGRTAEKLIEKKHKKSLIWFSEAMFQSREYTKDGEQRTAYEVCVRDFV